MPKILFLGILISIATATSAWSADLAFSVKGLRSATGSLMISVYDRADGFPDEAKSAVKAVKLKAVKDNMLVKFSGLNAGAHAVAFYHDENNNGKLDTNAFGMPTEGFGFSKDPRISFGAPSFNECAIEVRDPSTKSDANLKYY